MKRRDFLKNSILLGSAAIVGQGVVGQGVVGQEGFFGPKYLIADEIKPAGNVEASDHLTAYMVDHQAWFRWKNVVLTGYRAHPTQKYPYFFPLTGPATGLSLTAETAQPWPHHRSMLMACDRVNGGNFWQGTLESGQIISQGIQLGECTKTSGELIDTCLWQRPNQEPIIEDKRRFRLTVLSDDKYTVDCSFEVTPLVDISIQTTNHSLFSIRAAQDISTLGGGTLINSNGETKMAGTFGKPAKWCTFYGKRDRSEIAEGVAILCPPKPFENCPWFTRDYGFMSPTPFNFIKEPWQRQKGETLKLNYRIVAYTGTPEQAELDRLWDEFVS